MAVDWKEGGGGSLVRRLPFLALQSKQLLWQTMALPSRLAGAPAPRTDLWSREGCLVRGRISTRRTRENNASL